MKTDKALLEEEVPRLTQALKETAWDLLRSLCREEALKQEIMKTDKKTLLEEKIAKLKKRRAQALKEKDWLKAADLEIRIEATKSKLAKL